MYEENALLEIIIGRSGREIYVQLSPPDREGRRIYVEYNVGSSGHAFGSRDFACVVSNVQGLGKGMELSITQLRCPDHPEGYERVVGRVLSIKEYSDSGE